MRDLFRTLDTHSALLPESGLYVVCHVEDRRAQGPRAFQPATKLNLQQPQPRGTGRNQRHGDRFASCLTLANRGSGRNAASSGAWRSSAKPAWCSARVFSRYCSARSLSPTHA